MTTAKIAISLPVSTLRALERERVRLGKPRSALVAAAIETWLKRRCMSPDDQRYANAYLKHPERIEEVEAIAAAATRTWGYYLQAMARNAHRRA